MKKRPIALLIAMIVCILMGLSGFLGGLSDVAWFQGAVTDEARVPAGTSDEEAARMSALAAKRREIRDAARRRLLPLAVANMLLSALLFVAANRALVGRPGSRALVVQAIGANAALGVITHALTVDVRGRLIDALIAYVPRGALHVQLEGIDPTAFWLLYRLQLAAGLVVYALAWAAASTANARAYLAIAPPGDEPRSSAPDE